MKLIPNAKKAWRMASMQVAAAAVAFGVLPPETQAAMLAAIGVPASVVPALLGVAMILARLAHQPKVSD